MKSRDVWPALQRIITEDAVGHLVRGDGRMAVLGSENGELKLDWVEGMTRLLADPVLLEGVEAEAREMWRRGIRHVIWAGMGGSVLAVRVLTRMGFCSASSREAGHSASSDGMRIYPLDSTDPAALNEIVRQVAGAKGLSFPSPYQEENQEPDPTWLHSLLGDVLMIGVSMGMTSEEPITHLAWFADLLARAQLPQAEHVMVMTLPGSYLDQFAQERSAPSLPLQPDRGTGTGGRMSAPTTRVFLLPAALAYVHTDPAPGQLRAILRRAWEMHDLERARARPAEHPFVRLAAAMSDASLDGVCLLLVAMPAGWDALVPWLEQLMEESLGKGGKGVVVFENQPVHTHLEKDEGAHKASSSLTVYASTNTNDALPISPDSFHFVLSQPYLAATEENERLAALAASFMGWQLCMALFGYLHDIHFAGQPAVENYKARARVLRMQENPLGVLQGWDAHWSNGILTLYGPEGGRDESHSYKKSFHGTISPVQGESVDEMAWSLATALRDARAAGRLAFLDGTINGEASEAFLAMFGQSMQRIGNELLGVPVKLRRAPADYHSTEQSEMDGPSSLVSLRILARRHERCLFGEYDERFLCAQAVSTWQAMLEQGRSCFLLVVDGAFEDAIESLAQLFEGTIRVLQL